MSRRGWNFLLAAALKRAKPWLPLAARVRRLAGGRSPGGSAEANLASAIAAPLAAVESWKAGDSTPTAAQCNRIRKYLDATDPEKTLRRRLRRLARRPYGAVS